MLYKPDVDFDKCDLKCVYMWKAIKSRNGANYFSNKSWQSKMHEQLSHNFKHVN